MTRTVEEIDREIERLITELWDVLKPNGEELAQARLELDDPTDLELAHAVMDRRKKN